MEDTVHVLTRQGNVLGCYSLNQHQAPSEMTLTVVCRQGTVRLESHRNRWRWMIHPDEPWHDEPGQPLDRDAGYIDQANAFLDALEKRTSPLCSLEEGIQTLRTNLAVLTSVERGTWQTVGPERVPDGRLAGQMSEAETGLSTDAIT